MKMYLIHKKFNGIGQKEKDLQHDIVCYQQVSIDFFEMIIMLKFWGGVVSSWLQSAIWFNKGKGNSKTVKDFPVVPLLCGFWRVFCNIIPAIIQTVTPQEANPPALIFLR